ncbi:MAG: LamG domain-containing protein [Steroidobacteraceae bacterium]|nr:LamG domain-containing protein [Steroidobacteraceae bacterium]
MNAMQKFKSLRSFAALAAITLAATILAGCSSGGAPTTENPVTSAPPVADYVGPASANADVQAFRIELWEKIKPNNRCGSCHNAGGQTPMFARNDDVNLAYQAANTVVNLAQPDQSRIVAKVAGGHNCWLATPSACGDVLTVWVRNWAGASATGGTQIQLQAPTIREVGGSKSFPTTSVGFANTDLYRLVTNPATANCSRCHSSSAATPQQPFFAEFSNSMDDDVRAAAVDTAFQSIKSKISLDNPAQSRLVIRLRDESHNCWGNAGCATNAQTMLDAIELYANAIPITQVPPGLLISKGLTLYDGTVAAGGNRYEAATIAKFEFKTGMGNIAYDTSGHEPALNLTMSGDVQWVGGWGINVRPGGKAQGTASSSAKLTNLIKSTGEFSIEVWANNANVAQENAYIVSYSGGVNARNATLAQNLYTYHAYTRSDRTSGNGNPTLITRAADQDAQAALQHVVLTYSPVDGRRIYVNGAYTGDVDAQGGGSLAEWDDTFALVLGNETSTNRQWEGVLRLVAIHNRALTGQQIQQNFEAGVGEKYFMLFSVSHLVSVPDAYVMLEASQLDSYGIQFSKPTFISLATGATIPNLPIAGIRIGLNGNEAHSGQPYIPIDQTIGGTAYVAGAGQLMSPVGSVLGLDKGAPDDMWFLSFERIGTGTSTRPTEPDPEDPTPAVLEAEADVGLRTFDEINATLSRITGVPQTNTRVAGTFALVKQALPAIEKFGAFGPAQQTALAQIAMQYCNVLVDDNALRAQFFPGLDGSGTGTAVFGASGANNNANRTLLIDALINATVGVDPQQFQVTPTQIREELNLGFTDPTNGNPANVTAGLINRLVAGPTGGDATGGRTVMKAACGAVLGSGITLIQ